MKRLLCLIPALLSLYVLMLVVGCEEDHTECNFDPDNICVQISAAEDSLVFLTGDTASTHVTVLLTNSSVSMNGVRVTVSLLDTTVGRLEYSNPALRDTTNADGRVELVYYAWAAADSGEGETQKNKKDNESGSAAWTTENINYPNIIRASVEYISDSVAVSSREDRSQVPRLWISLHPYELQLSVMDSTKVSVYLSHADQSPYPGQTVLLSATGGRFNSWSATDSAGIVSTYWHADMTGQFILRTYFGYAADSTVVEVLP